MKRILLIISTICTYSLATVGDTCSDYWMFDTRYNYFAKYKDQFSTGNCYISGGCSTDTTHTYYSPTCQLEYNSHLSSDKHIQISHTVPYFKIVDNIAYVSGSTYNSHTVSDENIVQAEKYDCSDGAPCKSINNGANCICDRQCSEVGWNTSIDGSCADPCVTDDWDLGDNWVQGSIDSCNNLDISQYDASKIINPKMGTCQDICFLHLKPNTADESSDETTENDYAWQDKEMDFEALEQILDLQRMMNEIENQGILDDEPLSFTPHGTGGGLLDYEDNNSYIQDMWKQIANNTADAETKQYAEDLIKDIMNGGSGAYTTGGTTSGKSSNGTGGNNSSNGIMSNNNLSALPSAGGGSGGNSLTDSMKNLGDSVNNNTDSTNSNTDSLDTLNQNIQNLNTTLSDFATSESDIDDGADGVFDFVDTIKGQAESIETSVSNIQGLLEDGFEFTPPSLTSIPNCSEKADFIVEFVNNITFLAPIIFIVAIISSTIASIRLFFYGLSNVKL